MLVNSHINQIFFRYFYLDSKVFRLRTWECFLSPQLKKVLQYFFEWIDPSIETID
jgi:hypothetical protein